MIAAAGTPETTLPAVLWAFLIVPGLFAVLWAFLRAAHPSISEGEDL